MPVSTPPTFKPTSAPIALGALGTVLTSNGPTVAPTFQAAGGAAGALVTFVLAAGANNNIDPGGGWPTGFNRLDLDSSAGAANVTGLKAGTDGQSITLRNKPGGVDVTLNNLNAGSIAANQFESFADFILSAGAAITIMYYAGAINNWIIVP